MKEWKSLSFCLSTYFRPGAGTSSEERKEMSYSEVAAKQKLSFGYFCVAVESCTPHELKGHIKWHYDYLHLDGGAFELNENNKNYATPDLNVAYDTHQYLIISLNFE